jgi:hypothetical protein
MSFTARPTCDKMTHDDLLCADFVLVPLSMG